RDRPVILSRTVGVPIVHTKGISNRGREGPSPRGRQKGTPLFALKLQPDLWVYIPPRERAFPPVPPASKGPPVGRALGGHRAAAGPLGWHTPGHSLGAVGLPSGAR